jgi:fructose-1,6-bisphosphatase/inositol monophosphatase family enzyme
VAAGRGLGCFFDDAPCHVSDHATADGAYLSSTAFELWTPAHFGAVRAAGMELRTWGDAYGYALVASGRIEAMSDPVLAWWDLAALTVIIPEAGGVITTWDGEPEHIPNESGHYSAIASNGRFHDELVRILHP